MMDPVVSSKFGKRPLLEMPALHVESSSRREISSLQPNRPKPDFGGLPSIIYRSEGLTAPSQGPAQPALPTSAPPALPPIPGGPGPGGMFPAPQAAPVYPQPPFPSPGMMPPQMMPPMPVPPMAPHPMAAPPMAPPPMVAPQMVAPPPMPPMQPPPPPMYPAMAPSYQAHGYYGGGGGGGAPHPGMMAPPYPQHVRPRTPSVPANFHVEGVLQFGQLTTVHFRDKNSHFRGIPDYLRQELLKTYGGYPVTDIRLVAINGQIHIYANPRKAEDVDDPFSELGDRASTYGGSMTAETRKVGFNEVRGQPRELYPVRHGRTTLFHN